MCFKKEEKQVVQIKFGVPYFDVFDARFSDFGVPVSVRLAGMYADIRTGTVFPLLRNRDGLGRTDRNT